MITVSCAALQLQLSKLLGIIGQLIGRCRQGHSKLAWNNFEFKETSSLLVAEQHPLAIKERIF